MHLGAFCKVNYQKLVKYVTLSLILYHGDDKRRRNIVFIHGFYKLFWDFKIMVQIIPFIKLIQENFIGLNNVSFGFFSGIFKEKMLYILLFC